MIYTALAPWNISVAFPAKFLAIIKPIVGMICEVLHALSLLDKNATDRCVRVCVCVCVVCVVCTCMCMHVCDMWLYS